MKKTKLYKIEILPAAYHDLKDARMWYRAINPQLSKRFTGQVNNTLQNISSLPVYHAIRYKDVRLAQIPVFPYAIHYLMEEEKIVVLAVHHTAINPSKWQERLK